MAATPAAENSSVWLLLVCGHSQLTTSLMHSESFPFVPNPTAELVWRFENHQAMTAAASYILENQITFDAVMTRRLVPLIIESERLVVSMRDRAGAAHDYSFSLQPNGLALAGIMRHCQNYDWPR